MKPIYIEAIGVAMPGLDGWPAAAAVLRSEAPLALADLPVHQPALLPPNERRRATAAVRLAFRAAEEALSSCSLPAAMLASVFASSDADTEVIHRICTALLTEQRAVSPTDFHNSVHNAAPGYWSIAAKSFAPSVSLSAWEAVFAAGLLEAIGLIQVEGFSCLLVSYDTRPPEPLLASRGLGTAGGLALVLGPQRSPNVLARLVVSQVDEDETHMADPALEALRTAGTATRALPLLQALARREAARIVIAATGTRRLLLEVEPC